MSGKDFESRAQKFFTVVVHDELGRTNGRTLATLEETVESPDLLTELITSTLYRLGAAQAARVAFSGD